MIIGLKYPNLKCFSFFKHTDSNVFFLFRFYIYVDKKNLTKDENDTIVRNDRVMRSNSFSKFGKNAIIL